MQVKGKKRRYERIEDLPAEGTHVFDQPRVFKVMRVIEGSKTAILVDVAELARATALASGQDEDGALASARDAYLDTMPEFEIDDFEGDMFWQAYTEIMAAEVNPYAGSDARGGSRERNAD